jgi:hypothetical protein
MMAVAREPDIVIVDRELPRSTAWWRPCARTPRRAACPSWCGPRGDFDPAEVELLEAGANAILRCPRGRSGTSACPG